MKVFFCFSLAFVTELVVEDSSSKLSAPVWGCIVLSVVLLLVLLSNAALCKHYKGRHGKYIQHPYMCPQVKQHTAVDFISENKVSTRNTLKALFEFNKIIK